MPVPDAPDICPVCSHLVTSGAHSIEMVPGLALPMVRCPSFSEFVLDSDAVLIDPD